MVKEYIIETKQKSGNSNKSCYCKACFIKYGENNPELKTIVDKTECILILVKISMIHMEKIEMFLDEFIEEHRLYNIDVQSIDHPAISIDEKWRLEIILKNNISCPF